jgi:hypothetical protein
MKQIEITLHLPSVAPLLDVVKEVADSLGAELAVPLGLGEIDAGLREVWRAELLATQQAETRRLLSLFDRQFFESGKIIVDEQNAEAVLRACAALCHPLHRRLGTVLPEQFLAENVKVDQLGEPVRRALLCYDFLTKLQQIVLCHLAPEIMGARGPAGPRA